MQRHSGDLGRDSGEGGAGRTGFASCASAFENFRLVISL